METEIRNTTAQSQGSEGEWVVMMGWVILSLSIGLALMGCITLGHSSVYGVESWNVTIIAICISSGLSGAFFGYALAKIGSVLKHLEVIRGNGVEL